MRIYSWNILYTRKNFDKVFTFIEKTDFDVLLLQEVPEDVLAKLQKLPFHVASSFDWQMQSEGKEISIYLVTLSKTPFQKVDAIHFPEELYARETQPRRAQLFRKLMGWKTDFGNKTALRTRIMFPDTKRDIDVYNLHLSVLTPQARKVEFEYVSKQLDKDGAPIICGDFNIFETPHTTVANTIMGGSLRDWFDLKKERVWFEEKFNELHLQNPLRGTITHPFAFSQLDHVLVPKTFRVKDSYIVQNMNGSDHNPVFVEIQNTN